MTRELHPQMQITRSDGVIHVRRPNDERQIRALHGLTRALINNIVTGVTEGYSKTLEIRGTGYRAELQGANLVMNLGFSPSSGDGAAGGDPVRGECPHQHGDGEGL